MLKIAEKCRVATAIFSMDLAEMVVGGI